MSKRKPTYVLSCGACVYRNVNNSTQILLVKPTWTCPSWGIPKGHINIGETEEDCARREVLEEVGIDVKLEKQLIVVTTSGRGEVKDVRAWLAQQVDPEEKPFPADGENVVVQWFDINELPRLHKYQVPMIDHAVEMLRMEGGDSQ
jgi:bis(5'-nucleosidyl)-tetraphosphatase